MSYAVPWRAMRTVRGRFQDFEIGGSFAARPGHSGMRFDDAHFARAFLSDFEHDPLAMPALREIASRELDISDNHRWTDAELLDQIARQLAAGRLCAIPRERPIGVFPQGGAGPLSGGERAARESAGKSGGLFPEARLQPLTSRSPREGPSPPSSRLGHTGPPAAPAPQPASAPAGVVRPWITFHVIDEETGEPAANVQLRLRIPGGSVATYATDAAGRVHITDLPEGTCDLEEVIDEEALEVVQMD